MGIILSEIYELFIQESGAGYILLEVDDGPVIPPIIDLTTLIKLLGADTTYASIKCADENSTKLLCGDALGSALMTKLRGKP